MDDPGLLAMDIGTEGPLTARDARLAVNDCKAAIAFADKIHEGALKFWEAKIARIQARCPHASVSHHSGYPENYEPSYDECDDCGKEIP